MRVSITRQHTVRKYTVAEELVLRTLADDDQRTVACIFCLLCETRTAPRFFNRVKGGLNAFIDELVRKPAVLAVVQLKDPELGRRYKTLNGSTSENCSCTYVG
jgi:hypothetical protein